MADSEKTKKSTAKGKTSTVSETATEKKPIKKSAASTSKADNVSKKKTSKTTISPESKASSAKTSEKSKITDSPKTSGETKAKTSSKKASDKPAKTVKAKANAPKTDADNLKKLNDTLEKKQEEVERPVKTAPKKTAKKEDDGVVAADVNGEATVDDKKQRIRIYVITAAAVAMMLVLVLGLVLGLHSCNNKNIVDAAYFYDSAYKTNTVVGYYAEELGTVDRVKPVAEHKNYGLEFDYPTFGKGNQHLLGDDNADKRTALIQESSYLTSSNTANAGGGGYRFMDANGFLYNGTVSDPQTVYEKNDPTKPRQLFAHTASKGLYFGDVADDEPRLKKKVTMIPRGYSGYGVTGLYAPAGEVIKIEISEKDMNATGGIVIHIGQALYNGQANNIWTAKNSMPRIPHLLNTMIVTKDTATLKDGVYTAYVGSFIGGPIYIRNTLAKFTATISGGVAYQHFILGYTTEAEFEKNAKSSAPYFDLEVWDFGVLHSGSKIYAKNFTYDDIYKAAVLWDKVASVSTTGAKQGIVFLYEPFVAAGAAVAFPGRRSVNCPGGWMTSSLNYNQLVKSGAWGNFHEYHHNFQGYGVGNGGEVTNNGMTLVSYSLFTKISSARGIDNYGAAGLGGWNRYTSATWALEQNLKIARSGEDPENGNQGLSIYATLLHNFGADNYIKAKTSQRGGQGYLQYLKSWQDVTHNDMTYYFQNILNAGLTAQQLAEVSNSGYSKFIPISCVYQTGRSYMYDGEKKYINTMQPYVIPFGEDYTLDLRKYDAAGGIYRSGGVIVPDGFTPVLKSVTQPSVGSLVPKKDANGQVIDGVYTYVFDKNTKSLYSGNFVATFGIVKNDDPSFKVDDVDIVINLNFSHEATRNNLERTTYTYEAGKAYTDAQTAFESGFAGYVSKETALHVNPVQNCNTDVWFYPNNADYADSPFKVVKNQVVVVDGKLNAREEGKYRIYLRGRKNCALYYSLDGENYTLGATIKDEKVPSASSMFRDPKIYPNSYFDIELGENSWLYIKEILITEDKDTVSYMGVGMAQWTLPSYTIREETDSAGNTVTKYFDVTGKEVSEAEANNATIIEPVLRGNAQPYVTAYRNSYVQVNDEFTSDYLYKREYPRTYSDNTLQNTEQMIVDRIYTAPPQNWGWGIHPESYLIDGDRNTYIHTRGGVSSESPLMFAVDMGAVKNVNRMCIYSQSRADLQYPKAFTLYGSMDNETYFEVYHTDDAPHNGANVTVDFKNTEMRYYRIDITASSNTFIIIGEIELWNVFEVSNGKSYSLDDDMFKFKGKWEGSQAPSTYGHVYVGRKGSSVSFEFTGTHLAILSTNKYKTDFKVYIDGKAVNSVRVKDDDSPYRITFLSPALKQGTHKVEIRCDNEANIDSVMFFDDDSAA